MARVVVADDVLQPGYRYALVAPTGKEFALGFTPDVTPAEMLRMGVFDGAYFDGVPREFPVSWFAHAKIADTAPDSALNFFGVHASLSREEWERRGWIAHEHDPRGWFQWYCRYYLGRRLEEEDARQIKRWRAMVRHVAQIRKHCKPGDTSCRRVQRQALLHWAYDTRG